ncbi:helix-turn-helix domain-containing protein, partial [Chryseobacterium sp.]|uniref:helix-turn-helix domain-containing protein n=1 Tax=Chryseobacterium sp. TaxID=1871047 RepID=UPI00321A942F
YASQLLKIDSTLGKDYSYIPSKLHKDFDTINISKGKENMIFNIGLISLCSLMPFGFYFTRRAILTHSSPNKSDFTQKNSNSSFIQSETQIENHIELKEIQEEKKYGISEEKVSDILTKLETFEAKKEFTQKGLTITTLSQQLNTNNKYLSYVINEHKGKSFSKYLAELRIEYITQMLYTNKKFLDYKIEALSEECGIASRQNFSDIFYEINGMRPTDFIKKIKENHFN